MSNLTALLNKYKALVIFDTETSGLDFDKDQIIELAALRVERTASGGLRIAGKMDTFIKLPEGETLPENIVSLTGITDTLLQTEGVQPAKAASQIAKLMQPGPVLMIAHNAQFDACFLRGLLRGAKVGRIDWLDSLTVYKDRRPYPHKLANAILAYELEDKVQNSHRAIDDVLALFEVLKAMDDERNDRLPMRDGRRRPTGSSGRAFKAEPDQREKPKIRRRSPCAGVCDRHTGGGYMSKSPPITITSEELRERVEEYLDRWIPDDVWNRSEPYARRKLDLCRERQPEVEYYNNEYLVLLAADTVRETEFSDFTLADYAAKMAARATS